MQPKAIGLIQRYKANYGIGPDALVSEEMILRHWELEKFLRRELLASDDANRWDVFTSCYSRLYSELGWLNRLTATDVKHSPSALYRNWLELIGAPPQSIYEVGSGKGELIRYLSDCGFGCKATEITRERGERWALASNNLSWGHSDGVHLDRFEPANSYDVVISDQVIEHLHPDDLISHFKGAAAILKEKGRYIFSTPHAGAGPSDISRVFGLDKPAGMHLKEYNYGELASLVKSAGFRSVKSVLRLPAKIDHLAGHPAKPRVSTAYLSYLCALERVLAKLPRQALRRKAVKLARLVFFAPEIFLVAEL